MRIAVITDNKELYVSFKRIINKDIYKKFYFHFYSSKGNKISGDVDEINVSVEEDSLIKKFELIISLHCKQLFPTRLVSEVRCINIHPGFNPFNRGWYPQVFSILNKKPIGATIHLIDEYLDHGSIIVQGLVKEEVVDTSLSLYEKVQELEVQLMEENLYDIIIENYDKKEPFEEGNVNLKLDFLKLCKLDLNSVDTLEKHIDLLRALSHGDFKNAYFHDEEGKKVYLSLNLEYEK